MEFQRAIYNERGWVVKYGAYTVLLIILLILLGLNELQLPVYQDVLLSIKEGDTTGSIYTAPVNGESFTVGDSVLVLFPNGDSRRYRISSTNILQGRRQVQVRLGQAGEKDELLEGKIFLREEHFLKGVLANYSR
ncbi:hypothetical protein POKO110462_13345 [Pontibacter korlensis]|uniref:Uncharacterized protein n=1 Tax=Pontibacter korlensis TaxID=400092 RepID=A0A0E3ZGP8_9BACT|nr:hypothetical protein [Pontibacter korlensis]AKD04290.1 hypothetical protein PKOR_15835 [Pontibacter korlensis]